MIAFVLARTIRMGITLFGVGTLVFVLARLSGDPVALMVPEGTAPADIEILRERLGLDKPVVLQYVDFWSGILRGDLGTSIVHRTSALSIVLTRLQASAELAVAAMTIALVVGLPAGVISGTRPNSWFGRAAVAVAVTARATPIFVFGIFLVLIFAVELRLLPTAGRGELSHLIMPATTLAFAAAPTLIRITRAGMIEAMNKEYVRTARAKGLSTGAIIWGHALKNASLPVVTIIGIEFGGLLGGAAIVETLFAWPGLGYLAITALGQRDYPVVQAVLLVGAFWFVLANTVVDLAYAGLDPRTRSS